MVQIRHWQFLIVAAALLTLPAAAEAQQAARMFRIGWLSSQPPAPPGTAYRGGPYVKRMSELGYIEGKHYEFVVRLGNGDIGKLPALAADLARENVDLIVATGDQAADAVRDQRIPVVATTCQPIAAITQLVREGRNLTGITCHRGLQRRTSISTAASSREPDSAAA